MTAAEESLAIWRFSCTFDRKGRQPRKHPWLLSSAAREPLAVVLSWTSTTAAEDSLAPWCFFAASLIAGTQPRKNPWLSLISRKRTFGWRLILSNTNVFYTRRSVASRAVLFAERNCINDWNATLWISAMVMCRPGHASPWCAEVTSRVSQLRKQ